MLIASFYFCLVFLAFRSYLLSPTPCSFAYLRGFWHWRPHFKPRHPAATPRHLGAISRRYPKIFGDYRGLSTIIDDYWGLLGTFGGLSRDSWSWFEDSSGFLDILAGFWDVMRKFLGIIEDYRGLSRVLRYFWGIRLWCEDSSGFLDILAGFLDATQRFLGIIEDYRRFLRTIEGFLGFFWGEPRRILSREPRTLQDSSYFRWIFGHLEDSRPFQGIPGSLKCGIFQDAPQVSGPFQGNLKRPSGIFVDLRGSSRILQDSPIFF